MSRADRKRWYPAVLALLVLLPYGCGTSDPRFIVDHSGDPARAEDYLKRHMLQEAAWEYIKLGSFERADSILAELDRVLRSKPASIDRWKGMGIMENYVLTFENDIQGFFNIAGSDSLGPIANEMAAYSIDNLLRIHLTPITLIRDVTLENGSRVSGVIKYFVKASKTAEELELSSDQKPDLLLFFDTVIGNADRHLGNWMVRDDTKELFAIDHNRTFQFDAQWTWYQRMRTIGDPESLGVPYQRYRSLPEDVFRSALAPHLEEEQIDQFLKSRRIIIRYLDTVAGRAVSAKTSAPLTLYSQAAPHV